MHSVRTHVATEATIRMSVAVLGLLIGTNIILLVESPLPLRVGAALVLAWALPGTLLVSALVGESAAPPERWEGGLYAAGAGYTVMILTLFGLGSLPGGVTQEQTLAAFDLVVFLLLALSAGRRYASAAPPAWTALPAREGRRWLVVGLLSLFLVAGFLRLANLGYAEFQGDEARAILRAAGVIQGYEDVLFIHKKGPAEILIPTALYSLVGSMTESVARLPFALANLAALGALFMLGWRLSGPVTGWIAAMLLALDGYFIAFARIVQYQSIVFLTSVLVVLICIRLVRWPRAVPNYLALAALLLATGLLSHYEAGLVILPLGYLLWRLWRRSESGLARFGRMVLPSVLAGGIVLVAFYLPFVLHPNFQQTFNYLVEDRIGRQFPYNNLGEFFQRTTLYSSTYYLVMMIALAFVGGIGAYRRGYRPKAAAVLTGAVALTLVVTTWGEGRLTVGDADYTVLAYLIPLLAVWLAPRLQPGERFLWLWFGFSFLVTLFLTAQPGTHFYLVFIPWSLLSGVVLERLGGYLSARRGRRLVIAGGLVVAIFGLALFGRYAYLVFVQSHPEVVRTWEENRPRGYWTVYDRPDYSSTFGFPLNNGWKVVGWLKQAGLLEGAYATNEAEDWVPDWYMRGAVRDHKTATWFFQIENLENAIVRSDDQPVLPADFHLWGTVTVGGETKMRIYRRGPEEQPVRSFDLAAFEARFDASATPQFPLKSPAVTPRIQFPVHVNLGDLVWLEGYDLSPATTVRPGDTLELVLYWRAERRIPQTLSVFTHVEQPGVRIVAQDDGLPGTGRFDTMLWEPGQIIMDRYTLSIDPAAEPGEYALLVGMYDPNDGSRLDVPAVEGEPDLDAVRLETITVREP